MTTTSYTRNLRLRIDSNLTANAKYNLNKLDELGGTLLPDSTDQTTIRSRGDILIEPNSNDIGGSGIGGTTTFRGSSFLFQSALSTLDSGTTTGPRYLRIAYNSALAVSADTSADRTLTIDLDGSDRSLILGGSLTIAGSGITFTSTGSPNITVTQSGTMVLLDAPQTLTNKIIDGMSNSISNISLSSSVVGLLPIANGGTGSSTVQGARTALLPSQSGNVGRFLRTDGTDVYWSLSSGSGAVTSVHSWPSGQLTHTITHSLGTSNIQATIRDHEGDLVWVQVEILSDTQVQLTSSEAPPSNWSVSLFGAI